MKVNRTQSISILSLLFCIISASSGIALYTFGVLKGDTLFLSFNVKADKETSIQVASQDWESQFTLGYDTPGEWKYLQFPIAFSPQRLILKPSFVPNNRVEIRDIKLFRTNDDSQLVSGFAVDTLDPAVSMDVSALGIKAANPDGFIQFYLNLDTEAKPGSELQFRFQNILSVWPISFFLLAFLMLFVAFSNVQVVRFFSLKYIFYSSILPIFVYSAGLLAINFSRLGFTNFSTIGKSNYLGFNPLVMPYLTIIMGILFFTGLLFAKKKVVSGANHVRHISESNAIPVIPTTVFVFNLILFTLFRAQKARNGYLQQFRSDGSVSWDLENIQAWDGLYRLGFRPNEDFWYPYGSRIFLNSFPLLTSLLEGILVGLVGLFFLKWLNQHTRSTVIITLVPIALVIPMFSLTTDYFRILLPIVGILILFNCNHKHFLFHIKIVLISFLTLSFGSDTYTYWIIGLLTFILFKFTDWGTEGIKSSLIKTVQILLPIIIVQIFLCLTLFSIPFYKPIIEILVHSQDHLIASCEPMAIGGIPWKIWVLSMVFIMLITFVIFRIGGQYSISSLAVAISAMSILHLSKSACRPAFWLNNLDIVLLSSIMIVILTIVSTPPKLLAGSFLSLFLFLTWSYSKPLIPINIQELTQQFKSELTNEALSEKYVNQLFEKYGIGGDDLLNKNESVYIFGDSGMHYVYLKQKPFWHINLYNSAPERETEVVLHELKTRQPDVVLIDLDSLTFDLVPAHLRNYRILGYILDNWMPSDEMVQGFSVARRITSYTSMEERLSAWTEVLGNSIELESISGLESQTTQRHCNYRNNFCASILVERQGTFYRSVQFSIRGTIFAVHLKVDSPDSAFSLPLDYLWFMNFAST